jgi:hypothetical protein
MLAFPVRFPQRLLLVALLIAGSLCAFAAAASSALAAPKPKPTAGLRQAAHVQRVSDHRLVVKARKLKRCHHTDGDCGTQRTAVQSAGVRLQRAQRRLNRIARRKARRARANQQPVAAPSIDVAGEKLSWDRVSNVSRYVFVRKVPGQGDQYLMVTGTSTTPPAVPGKTVRYSVRADARGSRWADEVSISYPAVKPAAEVAPAPAPAPAPSVDMLAAPAVTVTGNALSWNQVGGVTTYVLVRRVAGQVDQYTALSGTSTTPAAVPGKTARYSVRTAIDGSAWSPEVAISYPAEPVQGQTPDPTPTPSPAPVPVDADFQMGLVAGTAHTYELRFLQAAGARTARIDFDINKPASQMAGDIEAYARAGIRPILLATFYGRVPSTSEAQNLATWAAAYGPGGTFWQGKSYPNNVKPTEIEFGNETSYSYQWSNNSLSTYSARAQSYAQRAKDAALAITAANPNVGLLAIGDNAVNQDSWMKQMLRAVPNLADLVNGWTIHPYGPTWATRIDSTINSAKVSGARDLPIWITEWGISTDNGRCLSDNYGFDKCMSYDAAATTLHSALAGMQARYGSRLGGFFLYQAHDQYASGSQSGREAFFGALQSNGATKGAYTREVLADIAANS